jgi:hypothetical protein
MSKIDKSWSQSGLWPAFHSTHTFLLRPLPARLSHFLSPLSRIGVNYVSTVSCLLLPAAPQLSHPVPLAQAHQRVTRPPTPPPRPRRSPVRSRGPAAGQEGPPHVRLHPALLPVGPGPSARAVRGGRWPAARTGRARRRPPAARKAACVRRWPGALESACVCRWRGAPAAVCACVACYGRGRAPACRASPCSACLASLLGDTHRA